MLSRLPRLRPLLAQQRTQQRRTLVSTVLLTRTWENESVASLRKAAKDRGISAKGSKANLILRITEYEKRTFSPPTPNVQAPPSSAPQKSAGLRSMTHAVAPGPGVPPTAATSAPPPQHQLYNVVIPDLSKPDPEPPVEVPYVPDFWDSITPEKPPVEEELPKMVVVGGLSTHPVSGPMHDLESAAEDEAVVVDMTPPVNEQPKSSSQEPGLLEDITQDLGIPAPKELKQSFWKLFS